MNVRILYFWVTLSFSFCTLLSCQTEELYVKEKNLGEKSGIKTEYLKGLEARKAANLLRTKFNGFGGTGQNHNLMREELTEIDYSNILMVMDTLGIKNYVFKIVNHPDDDLKTFHNLVLTDKEGEFALSIMKYHMTDLFAEQYYDMLKKIGEFEGTITSKGLQETDPCEDIVSNYPTPINDDPTTDYTGGGGGYEGSYDGPTFTDGGSDDNSDCIDVSFSILCECGRSYSSWEAYLASICGDGSNPGYDATLVITYDDNCGTNANRCNPDGVIGVIDGSKDCNSFENRIIDIIEAEGGFTVDPVDPGGTTNKGISWKVWVANANSILGVEPNLTNLEMLTDSQARQLYKNLYWDEIKCDDIVDGDTRYLLFDFYVNAGGNAIKILKKTLNSLGYNLPINGTMDDNTLNILNNHSDIVSLYNTLKANRIQYYNDLVNRSINNYLAKKPNATIQQLYSKTLKKYQNGWINRANKFQNKTNENSKNVNC